MYDQNMADALSKHGVKASLDKGAESIRRVLVTQNVLITAHFCQPRPWRSVIPDDPSKLQLHVAQLQVVQLVQLVLVYSSDCR